MNDYLAERLNFWAWWFGTLAAIGWIVVLGIAATHWSELFVKENLASFAFLVAVVIGITVSALLIEVSLHRRHAS